MEKMIPSKTFTDQLRSSIQPIIKPIIHLLAKLGISPNTLTIIGLLIHLPVAWYLAHGQFYWATLWGFLSLVDAFDGALARHLKITETSRFGAFLDSTIDRMAEALLFGGLMVYFYRQDQLLYLLITYTAIIGSLMVSYSRARAEALGVTCKEGWLSRVERYIILGLFGILQLPTYCVIILAVGTWFTVLQRGVVVWKALKQPH